MNYMSILETAIEASDNRDATLKAVEANLKNLQKMIDNVNS